MWSDDKLMSPKHMDHDYGHQCPYTIMITLHDTIESNDVAVRYTELSVDATYDRVLPQESTMVEDDDLAEARLTAGDNCL